MIMASKILLRLQFLVRVVRKECKHLSTTDQRRFGRLQDTVGDKLLPLLLTALGEKQSAAIDNLDRGERLGLIHSTDEWMILRNLRNQMVHEYIEDPVVLSSALQTGHTFVPTLITAADNMIAEITRRGWA